MSARKPQRGGWSGGPVRGERELLWVAVSLVIGVAGIVAFCLLVWRANA